MARQLERDHADTVRKADRDNEKADRDTERQVKQDRELHIAVRTLLAAYDRTAKDILEPADTLAAKSVVQLYGSEALSWALQEFSRARIEENEPYPDPQWAYLLAYMRLEVGSESELDREIASSAEAEYLEDIEKLSPTFARLMAGKISTTTKSPAATE